MSEEEVEEGRAVSPKDHEPQGPRVQRSKSHSNMSLTLKKVHLVFT